MLAVLGGLADVERDLIRTRTVEGRRRAENHRLSRATQKVIIGSADQRRNA
jgi:hypothetical protein